MAITILLKRAGQDFTFLWFDYRTNQYKVSLVMKWDFKLSIFCYAEKLAFLPSLIPLIMEYDPVTRNLNSTFLSLTRVHKVYDNIPKHLVFEVTQQRLYFQIFIFFSAIHFLLNTWIFNLFHVIRCLERFDFMRFFFWNHMTFVFVSLQTNSLVVFEVVFFFLGCKRLMQIFNLVLTFKIINYNFYR